MSNWEAVTSKTDKALIDALVTFRKRGMAYGDNHQRVGAALQALFANDKIRLESPDDFERFTIVVLILVKLTRYAVSWPLGHKDSIHDLIVYAAMLEARTDDDSNV
jgi:hypothetical protein